MLGLLIILLILNIIILFYIGYLYKLALSIENKEKKRHFIFYTFLVHKFDISKAPIFFSINEFKNETSKKLINKRNRFVIYFWITFSLLFVLGYLYDKMYQ